MLAVAVALLAGAAGCTSAHGTPTVVIGPTTAGQVATTSTGLSATTSASGPSSSGGSVSVDGPGTSGAAGSGSTGTTAATTRSSTTAPTTDAALTAALQAQVTSARSEGITMQAVVLDRASGATLASVGSTTAMPIMSLYKLMLATDIIYRAGGVDRLSTSELAQLRTMIVKSDDDIANSMWSGDPDAAANSIARYHLTHSRPPADPVYWGETLSTAGDIASLLRQALASPVTGSWLAGAMQAASDTGADGFDQDFGLKQITGVGVKQGWGCCLDGFVSLHTSGFTASRIVVIMTTQSPDAPTSKLSGSGATVVANLQNDPGTRKALAVLDAAARIALDD